MKITQLHIYLFMWYEATESLTNTTVTLGADVIITCDLDIKDIYWYKQNYPDPPVLILRTYSDTHEGGDIFEPKYSVKTNSSLFIKNITTDELAVYYCLKTSKPQKISNGTKLYISDVFQNNVTDYRNQTESNDASQYQIPWKILTITSALLNVLTIAVIGLSKSCLNMTSKSKNTSEKPQGASAAQSTNDQQYAEIDFSKQTRRKRPRQDDTTYSLLKPVKTV